MTLQTQPVYRVQDWIPLEIKPYFDSNRVIDNEPKPDAVANRFNLVNHYQQYVDSIAENNNPIPQENPYLTRESAYERLNDTIEKFTQNFSAALKAQNNITPEDVTKLFSIGDRKESANGLEDKGTLQKTIASMRDKFQSAGFEKFTIHNISKNEVVSLFENKAPQKTNPFNTNGAFDMTTKITRTYNSFSEPNFVSSM